MCPQPQSLLGVSISLFCSRSFANIDIGKAWEVVVVLSCGENELVGARWYKWHAENQASSSVIWPLSFGSYGTMEVVSFNKKGTGAFLYVML